MTTAHGLVVLGVGDVMGRGVASATTMSRIRTAARAYAWLDPEPAAVLSKLDAFVSRETPDDFVTMLYAVLDPGSGCMRLVNAGHLPPVHISAGGTCTQVVGPTQLPLGLTAAARPLHLLRLEPGDALFAFTDGLVERRDQAIDASLAALVDVLRTIPPRARVGQIIERVVAELTADLAPGDDVTALIVRRAADGGAAHKMDGSAPGLAGGGRP